MMMEINLLVGGPVKNWPDNLLIKKRPPFGQALIVALYIWLKMESARFWQSVILIQPPRENES